MLRLLFLLHHQESSRLLALAEKRERERQTGRQTDRENIGFGDTLGPLSFGRNLIKNDGQNLCSMGLLEAAKLIQKLLQKGCCCLSLYLAKSSPEKPSCEAQWSLKMLFALIYQGGALLGEVSGM